MAHTRMERIVKWVFLNRLLFDFAFMSPFFDEKVPRVEAEWGVLALTNETCTIVFGGLSTKLK